MEDPGDKDVPVVLRPDDASIKDGLCHQEAPRAFHGPIRRDADDHEGLAVRPGMDFRRDGQHVSVGQHGQIIEHEVVVFAECPGPNRRASGRRFHQEGIHHAGAQGAR